MNCASAWNTLPVGLSEQETPLSRKRSKSIWKSLTAVTFWKKPDGNPFSPQHCRTTTKTSGWSTLILRDGNSLGDIVIAVLPGDYGQGRMATMIQAPDHCSPGVTALPGNWLEIAIASHD